jgi:hypothetical protein
VGGQRLISLPGGVHRELDLFLISAYSVWLIPDRAIRADEQASSRAATNERRS